MTPIELTGPIHSTHAPTHTTGTCELLLTPAVHSIKLAYTQDAKAGTDWAAGDDHVRAINVTGKTTAGGEPIDGISYCITRVMQHQPRTVFVKVNPTSTRRSTQTQFTAVNTALAHHDEIISCEAPLVRNSIS